MNHKKKNSSPPHRHFSAGVPLIERTIAPDGSPVLGLYLYMANAWLVRSMSRGSSCSNRGTSR
jgi:hypothetical protein